MNTAEFQGVGHIQDCRRQRSVGVGGLHAPVLQLCLVQAGQRSGTGLQGHAELLVLVSGRDRLVGGGVHARGDANQHRNGRVGLLALSHALGGQLGVHPLNQLDFVHRIGHHAAQAATNRAGDFGLRFVVAVQGDALAGHAAAQSQRQLATGGGVQAQALLTNPANDRGGEEGLAGVVDAHLRAMLGESLLKSGAVSAGTGAEGGLGENVLRGAVLGGQLADGHTVDAKLTLRIAGEGIGPDASGQVGGVLRLGQPFGAVEGTGFAHRVSFWMFLPATLRGQRPRRGGGSLSVQLACVVCLGTVPCALCPLCTVPGWAMKPPAAAYVQPPPR